MHWHFIIAILIYFNSIEALDEHLRKLYQKDFDNFKIKKPTRELT